MIWLRTLRARMWAEGLTRELERLVQQRGGYCREIERIDAELIRNADDFNACAQEAASIEAARRDQQIERRFRLRGRS